MEIRRHNDVVFRGQFAIGYDKLMRGETIDINTFHNGAYESTSKVKRFIALLRMADIKVNIIRNERGSLRSIKIILDKAY